MRVLNMLTQMVMEGLGMSKHIVDARIEAEGCGIKCRITFIHPDCDYGERQQNWDQLRHVKQEINEP